VDAVLPLVQDDDKALGVIFNTRLFDLIMTFNVTENPDAIYD
jgi:hypothetical protein